RQCYRELNIGVARPSEAELATVPHYFIASHSVQDNLSAADFALYASNQLKQLFQQHKVVVMAGGTGLYIKALCEGLDEIPPVPQSIRDAITKRFAQEGIGWLQDELAKRDPAFWAIAEQQNPRRLQRALEVLEATGQSITSFQKGGQATHDFNIVYIGIELPREVLYERINQRVDAMIQAGLLQEVQAVQLYANLPALQTVGYTELFDYLEGKWTLDLAVEKIKQHTRNYAKRQMTWFKKDEKYKWFSPDGVEAVLAYLSEKGIRI
ncbi:MAG TPA: tRNA (adenosine(37)-N6)-dimethylallyltransferase MiaA, partial [Chitinophagaceae bacterium]|nr:tRNA (adenosine(37)-N6)-dimethylallyltransferase MiaA [Chitinophagaceae bacterium]